jgi:hypothetical protein
VTAAPNPSPHETAAAPSPAAERMRRHRTRRKNKFRCLTLELHEAALCRNGYLHAHSRNDPDAIAGAFYDFFDRALRANL